MTTTKQQALEALNELAEQASEYNGAEERATTIRAFIESQPDPVPPRASGEAVAWRWKMKDDRAANLTWRYEDNGAPDSWHLRECVIESLYAAPQPPAAEAGEVEK